VGVVTFGSRADLLCALTADAGAVARAVAEITASGTTAMGAGIGLALDLLAREQTIALRQIVLVSDGMPDKADEALRAGARARDQGVILCLLGLGREGVNEEFLRQVSPEVLMVESAAGIGGAIAGFLTQSAPASGQQAGITWLGR
jgi:Mg-chelatase subunit ChlD